MKFVNKSLHKMLHGHAFGFGIFVVLFVFFFFAGSLVVANGQTLGPNDSHVVNLFVDGQETNVPTRAASVADFLARAGVPIYPADLVEPATNAQINADNFRIQIYRARPVTVIDGTNVVHVLTPQKSARLISKEAGITVYPEDNLVLTTASDFVNNQMLGEKLTINRATAITLSLYGSAPLVYRTQATTINDFLKEKGITPEAGATIMPGGSTSITSNLAIFISKFGKTVVTTTEPVDFPVQTNNDPNQTLNKITIITPGVLGQKQVVYEVELRDGQEVSRRPLQEVVIVQPQTQIQTKGTKTPDITGDKISWMTAAGIADSDFYYVDFIIGHESGWAPGRLNAGGCAGLGQACPGSKLARACPNWQSDPVCQLRFFSSYAGRYGGWAGSYNAWNRQGWW